jgi:hypothetical protein
MAEERESGGTKGRAGGGGWPKPEADALERAADRSE